MTLTLNLPPDVEAQLAAEAAERGLSREETALLKLQTPWGTPPPAGEEVHPLIRLTEEIFGNIPEAERETLPLDYAANYKHYLHGYPKSEGFQRVGRNVNGGFSTIAQASGESS